MDLIIGSNGFLGRNFKNFFINSFSLTKEGVFYNNKKVYSNLKECFHNENINTIFNCAISYKNNDLEELNNINFLLPKKIIDITKNTSTKIIFFGSFFEKEKRSYMQNYTQSKIKLSNYLREVDNNNIYHLNLEHIYGKHDRAYKFIPSVISKIKNNIQIRLDSPNNIRDFTPVDHITNFCKFIKENGYKKNFINIGTGVPQTTLSFVKKLINSHAQNNQKNFSKFEELIEIGSEKIDIIKESYCKDPFLLSSYNSDYFKKLETKTLKDLLND